MPRKSSAMSALRRVRYSRPLRPTVAKRTVAPAVSFSRHARSVALLMFVLKAPQRPRSLVRTKKRTVFSSRRARSGCESSFVASALPAPLIVAATLWRTSAVFTAYGRIETIRCWARVRRAPATIFMARVIFCVALVLVMRLRIVLSEATGSAPLLLLGLLFALLFGLLFGLLLGCVGGRRGLAPEGRAELVEGLL